jgi:uncharacterized protein YecE (DUF72 family)
MTTPVNEEPDDPAIVTPLRIGPAGWSYRDWEGIVYPRSPPQDFDPLRWLAHCFDLVEINVSFYRVPAVRQAAQWAERVRDTALHFSAKIPQDFTHRGAAISRDSLGAFADFLGPLAEARRLDVVLAQYPWRVRPDRAALARMCALDRSLQPYSVVHEVRNAQWAHPQWQQAVTGAGLDLVHVDQPLMTQNLGPECGPGRRAYVRLHGRNAPNWFDPRAGRDARYDWLYSIADLQEWADRVRTFLRTRTSVHVVTNNHFRGQAVVNALELSALLGRPAPAVPSGIPEHFAGVRERWAEIGFQPDVLCFRADGSAERDEPPRQGELFS